MEGNCPLKIIVCRKIVANFVSSENCRPSAKFRGGMKYQNAF